MADLSIQGLSKSYGSNKVIENISFDVAEGEFFVLLGPSGGGKSTFLRVLCGLESPDTGIIRLGDVDITRLPSRERNIGMVFQDYGLYPHMNAYQNIAYGMEARGVPKQEVDKRVRAAAEKLGLTALLERVIVDLSGGEQQRVALARALAKDAELYLFDEPLSNLDPKLRSAARRDIIMIHREKHKPTIYVTHDQTEALAISDRIGIIAHGQMQQVGKSDELINEPSNMFVASFIGTPPMNLLPGIIVHENGQYRVNMGSLTFALPKRWSVILQDYNKDRVVVGIRPSSMAIEGTPSDFIMKPENIVTGLIKDIEPLIGETIVSLKFGDNPINAVFTMIDESVSIGQTIRVGFDVSQFRLFNPDTELALV